ncbi:MAG: hypothetical protein J7M12_02825 [Candidatus Hydrogenedentes bacterium]|nr:hypothetical protein [Candidatus Hydrogenedentota bacterium]
MNTITHSKRNHRIWLAIVSLALCAASVNAMALDFSVNADSARLDQEFEVAVHVANGTDLYGAAFDLIYDPDVVEPVDSDPGQAGLQPVITEGDLLGADSTHTIVMADLEDGEPGTLVIGYSRTGPVTGVDVSADTVLLTVTFRGLSEETTGISFANMRADNSSGEINATWTPETFSVTTIDPEGDEDNDGLTNAEEESLGTDVYNPDTDGDGMTDGWEVDNGLLPLTDDADSDADQDGLSNGTEFGLGTNPQSLDTDGDGYTDTEEVDHGGDPTDGDNVPSPWLVSVSIVPQEPVIFADTPFTFSVTGTLRDDSAADLTGATITWSVSSGVGDIDPATGEYLSSESDASEVSVQVELDTELVTDTVSFAVGMRAVIAISDDVIVDADTVNIPVTLTSGGGSVAKLSFTLGLDSTIVEMVSIDIGDAAANAGKTITVTQIDDDNYSVEISGGTTVIEDGTVAVINLKAAATGRNGQCSDLLCQTPAAFGADDSVIATVGTDGQTCLDLSFKPGDVDRNGSRNASDIQFVINRALGIPVVHNCDINNDGTVNAIDVQLVINAVLGIEIQV